jgi:triacylglycerol lipase
MTPRERARAFVAALPRHRNTVLAVLGGALGDRMTIPMQLHAPRELGRSTCVFVHGLMSTPSDWQTGEIDYAVALRERLGVTCVHVEYNSGRHISENGRELAHRLEAAIDDGVEELTFIAHSMGGLVTRSACHYGLEAGHRWVTRVRRVFLLGVPSHGAPLEQLAHVAAFTLATIWNPWTRLVGGAINLRSAGIKDLRHGFVLDEDWRHKNVDQLRLAQPRPARLPPDARWYAIAGALGGDPQRFWPRVLGDGLVREPSTRGVGFGTRDGVLPIAESCVLPSLSHARLMTDPAVLECIVRWW